MALAFSLFCFLWAPLAGGAQNPAEAQVNLQPVRFEQWKRERASLKGQIVVVDVWATWCAPCLEGFPHMVRLYDQYKGRGVTFVSMSVDDREDKQAIEMARQFLRRQNATFRNYLMDENITQAMEKLDVLGIPAVFIYDRSGRLRHNFNGNDPEHQFTQKQVDKALARLAADRNH